MPPRKQITEEQIIDTAFSMVREEGMESLSVRNLAKRLNCSTQPIYFSFQDMDTLKNALGKKAMQQMDTFVQKNKKEYSDPLLANILGYVQFAYEEKHLYQLMFFSNVMTMEQTRNIVADADQVGMNMMIYANGLIMMSSFGTMNLPWKQLEALLIQAYHSFKSVQ